MKRPEIAKRLFGEPALRRLPDGRVVVTESARRRMTESAVRDGRLLTVDALARATETTRAEVLDAIRGDQITPWPHGEWGRLLFSHDEARRYARLVYARRAA